MPNPIRIKTANGWQDLALTGVPVFEQASDPGVQPPGTIWIDTDDVPPIWVSPIPLVSSLPTNPSDGQEVYFLADAANGVIWHLRYRSGSSSAYKWEFLGGPPLFADSLSTYSVPADNVYRALPAAFTRVTPPLTGDYDVEGGATAYLNTVSAADVFIAIHDATNAQLSADNQGWGRLVQQVDKIVLRTRVRRVGVVGGRALDTRGKCNGATTDFFSAYIMATPVRVG